MYVTSVEEIRELKRVDKSFNIMKLTITEKCSPRSHTSLTGYEFLLSPITSVFNNVAGFVAQNETDKTHEISFNNKQTKSPNPPLLDMAQLFWSSPVPPMFSLLYYQTHGHNLLILTVTAVTKAT